MYDLEVEISRFKRYVLSSITSEYKIEKSVAERMIEDSVFGEMVKEEFDFVGHYSPEYWAQEVWNETERNKR